MANVLVTGGGGFIGSNLVRHLLADPANDVRVLDAFTYAVAPGTWPTLAALDDRKKSRLDLHLGDICNPTVANAAMQGIDVVYHLAAESHVDRSIVDPGAFVRTNVLGTQVLLDAARRHQVQRFLYVSTDEVMGSLRPDEPPFDERSQLQPNSPYSASKAGGEVLARAYYHTYGLPVLITRCSNNYGPFQFPEKLIPLAITRLLAGQKVPVYGDGLQVRDWLYVSDHCRALTCVMKVGLPGKVYCIGGDAEHTNLGLIGSLCELLELDAASSIEFVTDRLGHDRRYAVDAGQLKDWHGWEPRVTFRAGLALTISWYRQNRSWWEPLLK